MVIEGVNEKFEELKELGFYPKHSAFILCDCNKNNNKYELNTIIPLENNMSNIVIDRNSLVLTNIMGNILLEFDNNSYRRTSIEFVNDNDLIISNYDLITPNFVPKRIYKKISHYHYNKELNLENILYNISHDRLNKMDFINDDVILLEKSKLYNNYSSLYSIKQKNFISPNFIDLEPVEKTNYKVFKYTDIISSSLEINRIKFSSKIIGFITVDGKFYNGVYDELTNKEIECELNSKPNFEEYLELKKMIEGKLNEKVIKESNKKITKDFIIKKLENKAKNIIK